MSSFHLSAMSLSRNARPARGLTVLCAATFFLSCQFIAAQQVQPTTHAPAGATTKKSPRHRARQASAPVPLEEPAAPQPELPKWPVNDSPNKAAVTWDSSGLKIQANNASLHQILNEVSADTGAKVEGIGADERVFGEYGPGTTRDVISQLLHGSSYNVLMIGDQRAPVGEQSAADESPGPAGRAAGRGRSRSGRRERAAGPAADHQQRPSAHADGAAGTAWATGSAAHPAAGPAGAAAAPAAKSGSAATAATATATAVSGRCTRPSSRRAALTWRGIRAC